MENNIENKMEQITEDLKSCTYHVGLNIGNYFAKIVGENGKEIFKSSAEKIEAGDLMDAEKKLGSNGSPRIIKVNNTLYRMTQCESNADDIDNRPPEIMRALIAYSIARQLVLKKGYRQFDICNVIATMGLPIVEYMEREKKLYMLKNFTGTYYVEYMGMKIKICIGKRDLKIVAEGFVYYQINHKKYAGIKRLYIIDIGSRTTDSAFIYEGESTETESLVNWGTLCLFNFLRKRLGKNFPEAEIEELIRTGSCKLRKEVYKLSDYDDIIDDYVRRLVGQIKNKHNNITDAEKIVVFGGGAYLLKDRLKNYFPEIDIEFVEESEYANAEAYYVYSFKDSKTAQ